MLPSYAAVASTFPSRRRSSPVTPGAGCAKRWTIAPSLRRQIRALLSTAAVASNAPSGLKATSRTIPRCRVNLWSKAKIPLCTCAGAGPNQCHAARKPKTIATAAMRSAATRRTLRSLLRHRGLVEQLQSLVEDHVRLRLLRRVVVLRVRVAEDLRGQIDDHVRPHAAVLDRLELRRRVVGNRHVHPAPARKGDELLHHRLAVRRHADRLAAVVAVDRGGEDLAARGGRAV